MISLEVNGRKRRLEVAPDTPLLYVLRNDLGLNGPRFGCGLGQCGACTVIMDGAAAGDVARLERVSDPRLPRAAQGRGPPAEPAGREVARQR